MSNDPQNPISNETGEYLQEVAEKKTEKPVETEQTVKATPNRFRNKSAK